MGLLTLVASVYLVCGIVLFFLGITILSEDYRGRLNRITSLMLFFAGSGPIFAAFGTILKAGGLASTTSVFYTNIFFLWELFFPQLLLFSLVFPVENLFLKKHLRAKILIFTPHIFRLLLVLFLYQPRNLINLSSLENVSGLGGFILQPVTFVLKFLSLSVEVIYRFHLQFFSIINLTYLFLAVLFLYQGTRKLTQSRLKTQAQLVTWGIRSAAGLYAVAFILPALTSLKIPDSLRYALTIGALLIGSGSIAWSIIRYRFLDIRTLVRQSLVYSLTSALLLGIYFLLITQLSNLMQTLLGRRVPILEIGYLILAIFLFQPIMGWIDELVKRLLLKDKADYRIMMEMFSRKIISILNLDELNRTIFEALKKEMLVEEVYLCLCDAKNGRFSLFSEDKNLSFPEDDHLIQELRLKDRPFFLDELSFEKDTPLFKTLSDSDVFLIVPIYSSEEFIGFFGLTKKITGLKYTYEDLTLLKVLANQFVVAYKNAQLYQESLEKQKIEEELLVAKQIQLGLLPKAFPKGKAFELSAYTQPAHQVGGDYYDFLERSDGSLGVAIADASGKGVPAALMVSLLHASLRAMMKNKFEPSETISNINQLISSSVSDGRFATMFYGEFNPHTRKLSYCNAGHNYPIVIRKDQKVEFLKTGGLILGPFPEATYQMEEILFESEDLVFFYSDGLTENFNEKQEMFGEDRLLELLLENRKLSCEELKELIVGEVENFAHGISLYDDFTIVILKVL
ncbi:MAG: SpoIIE family protein phosphatase [candidate division Zixibacteria bacterium]|nr:SpoIIE family protein phosphatase [candidate division Zixibacteria bacterium]